MSHRIRRRGGCIDSTSEGARYPSLETVLGTCFHRESCLASASDASIASPQIVRRTLGLNPVRGATTLLVVVGFHVGASHPRNPASVSRPQLKLRAFYSIALHSNVNWGNFPRHRWEASRQHKPEGGVHTCVRWHCANKNASPRRYEDSLSGDPRRNGVDPKSSSACESPS